MIQIKIARKSISIMSQRHHLICMLLSPPLRQMQCQQWSTFFDPSRVRINNIMHTMSMITHDKQCSMIKIIIALCTEKEFMQARVVGREKGGIVVCGFGEECETEVWTMCIIT